MRYQKSLAIEHRLETALRLIRTGEYATPALARTLEASTAIRYCRMPFETEPDFKATSVNYDLEKRLAQAQEPA